MNKKQILLILTIPFILCGCSLTTSSSSISKESSEEKSSSKESESLTSSSESKTSETTTSEPKPESSSTTTILPSSSSSEKQEGHYYYDEKEGYTVVTSAKSYLDLPLWNKYKDDHWQIASPYKGNRTDFRDESIYFVMTTRFYDGDKNNNTRCWDGNKNGSDDPEWRGDFKGLIQKMDYIKALGFTSIWITPVTENASGYDYHGYHTINFKQVDKRYESSDVSFLDVIKEAHKRDMKIILDIVLNHTCNFGEENLFPMFDKTSETYAGMKQKDKSLLPNNYSNLNGGEQYNARINAMKGSADKNDIYHHEKNLSWEQYTEQTGQIAGDCVDLNTENPTVANYLIEAYGQFIRMGVDAFRIDTMKHISRLTFNNYFFPAFKHYAEKCGNPNFYMFGEVCTRVREVWNRNQAIDSAPFYTWKESKSYPWGTTSQNMNSTLSLWNDNKTTNNQPSSNNVYLNNGLTYHKQDLSKSNGSSVIDFPMHWNFQYARDAYNVAVNNDKWYNDASYNVVYVDSHDYGPDGISNIRYNQGTEAWKENMDLMFTFRGVPCLFYGSEIEFQKGCVIDDGPNKALKETGRAYYGANLEGNVSATDFDVYTASGTVSNTLNKTLSKHLRMLIELLPLNHK